MNTHLTQFRQRSNEEDRNWPKNRIGLPAGSIAIPLAAAGGYGLGKRMMAGSARKTNAAVAGRAAKTVAAAPSPAAAAQVVRSTKDPVIRRAQGKLPIAEEAAKRRMGKTKRGLAITSGPAAANPKTGPMAAYYAGRDFQGEQPTVDFSTFSPKVVSAVLNNLRASGTTTDFAYPNDPEDNTLRNTAVAGAGVAGGIYARGRFGKGYKPGQGFGTTMGQGARALRGDVSKGFRKTGQAVGLKGGMPGVGSLLSRMGRAIG